MDRPFVGRPLVGGLHPQAAGRAPRRSAAGKTRRPSAPRAPRRHDHAARAISGCTTLLRLFFRLLRRHRRLRRAFVAVPVACALLVGAWVWLRDSSLVSVQRVQITGVHGPEAAAIDAALTGAARHMTTLDLHPAALRAAVAPFRVVRDVQATAAFPHALRIRVIEQLPVASLALAGGRTAVAADGVVLGPALDSSALPTVASAAGAVAAGHVRGAALLVALAVLGACPEQVAPAVSHLFSGSHGLTVAMRNGLEVYFGDGSRPHAKWSSLARVLADTSSAGASYIDVRLPERPAAGFPGGAPPATTPASAAAGSEPAQATPEAATAAIAASLAAALPAEARGGPAKASAPTPSYQQSPSTTPGEAAVAAPSEATSSAPAQSPAQSQAPAAAAAAGG
jgi:cell division protein FtsQ